jgi:uncharacterized membrane protein
MRDGKTDLIGRFDRRERSFPLARSGAAAAPSGTSTAPHPDGRSTMKIATYGTMHLGVAFGVAYALTGNLRVAGAIALVEPAVQTVAYALHERAWRDPAAIRQAVGRALATMRRALMPTLASRAAAVR